MHSILVRDYMDGNAHAVRSTWTVKEVVNFLYKEKVTGAPVLNDKDQLIGFVSEQDCLLEALNDSFHQSESPSVESVMSKAVATTTPSTSIVEMAQLMATTAPRVYPVIEDGKLIGVITRSRILDAIVEYK
jgi:predicted transcriptional regulator